MDNHILSILKFFFLFLSLFEDSRERGGGRERETSMGERNQWVASQTGLTGDGTCNPGVGPDRGSNPQPFAVQDNAPTN